MRIFIIIYALIALLHAVGFNTSASGLQKVKDFIAALAFPGWWIYEIFKKLFQHIKGA